MKIIYETDCKCTGNDIYENCKRFLTSKNRKRAQMELSMKVAMRETLTIHTILYILTLGLGIRECRSSGKYNGIEELKVNFEIEVF